MKANLPSLPIARDRVFIPVTEFTYTAYSIEIKFGFGRLFGATRSSSKPRSLCQPINKKIIL